MGKIQEDRLRAEARRLSKKSKSENTLKVYASGWADFTTWCKGRYVSLPATVDTVTMYISHLARE